MATRKAVLAALTLLSRAYAGKLSEEQADVYEAALHDLTDAEVERATVQVIRTYERDFIPPPAVLRAAAGKTTAPLLDVSRILREIADLGGYTGEGFYPPSVPKVRAALGAAIAGAYAAADMGRLFSEDGTSRDIARRDFAGVLADVVHAHGTNTLPGWAVVAVLPEHKPQRLEAGDGPEPLDAPREGSASSLAESPELRRLMAP